MANIKSAKKRIRTSEKRAIINKSHRTSLRTSIKSAEAAIKDNADNKTAVVHAAIKKIDSAAGQGFIHMNKAARKKSQLVRALNS